ncbi:MAG: prepilin-type N-terminal cleavage/methylation domain-containing protein [Egibacteraceae bacterium]
MLTRLRRRLDGDDGISLVEMLVAFVILGVVMSASASFFTTALVSVQNAESRTKATALANEELENLRVLAFDEVGFYDDDFDGAIPPDTVLLASQRPVDARAPLPEETLDASGLTVTVRRSIVWIDNTQTSAAQDYKQLRVALDWSDRGQARSVSVDSLRSPTPDEAPGSDFVLSLLGVAPELVYINSDGTLDTTLNDSLALTALTSAEADFVAARYVQRGVTDVTERSLVSSDHLNWSGTVTAADGHTFPNGDVLFTFVATRASPYEQEVIGSTLVRFLQPLAVVSVTSTVCVTSLVDPVDIDTEIDGLVDEDTVTVTYESGTVNAQQTTATAGGSLLTATIPGGSLAPGSNTITTAGQRGSDGATVSRSTVLEVQLVGDTC